MRAHLPNRSRFSRYAGAALAGAGLMLAVACGSPAPTSPQGGLSLGGGSQVDTPKEAAAYLDQIVKTMEQTAKQQPAGAPGGASRNAAPAAAQSRKPATDPCRLVTRAEAEAAVGRTLKPASVYPEGSGDACEYADDDFGIAVIVTASKGPGTKMEFDGVREITGGETVSGLGDRAYISPLLRSIYVLKGDTLVSIQIINFFASGSDTRTGLITLANKAVSRL